MNAVCLAIVNCVFLYVPVLAYAGADVRSSRPITEATCVFAIYTEDWGFVPQHKANLVFGIWGDGHIVWSIDQVRGGPPFRASRIDPADVRRFFADIDRAGVFDPKTLPRSWVPVDSDFISIMARWQGRQLLMRSRHEIDEQTAGRRSTPGPPQFRRFRDVWQMLRRRSALLIPAGSVLIQGELVQIHGDITWHEAGEQP